MSAAPPHELNELCALLPSSAILDQSTSAKHFNSRANEVGIEQPKVRHRHSDKHLKTLTSILID